MYSLVDSFSVRRARQNITVSMIVKPGDVTRVCVDDILKRKRTWGFLLFCPKSEKLTELPVDKVKTIAMKHVAQLNNR